MTLEESGSDVGVAGRVPLMAHHGRPRVEHHPVAVAVISGPESRSRVGPRRPSGPVVVLAVDELLQLEHLLGRRDPSRMWLLSGRHPVEETCRRHRGRTLRSEI